MAIRRVQRATITDVARLAGVSISTVSRVLNETAPVADETVERVRHAVDILNFTPHAAARMLAVRKTDTIGLLLPEIGSSFFVPTLRGIESAVREAGLDLLIFTGTPGGQRRREWRQPLGDHNTDGLLVFSNLLNARELSLLYQHGFPVVLLHRSAPPGTQIPSIRFDNRAGMRKLLGHLIQDHDRRQENGRLDHGPAGHAAGEGGGQLLFALQAGQGDQRPDEQADGQDHGQQLRYRQQGQLDHDPDALATLDDDFELVEALAQNADSDQRSACGRDGQGNLAKEIALNEGHDRKKSPGCRRAKEGL